MVEVAQRGMLELHRLQLAAIAEAFAK
jgi:hypothetical protein